MIKPLMGIACMVLLTACTPDREGQMGRVDPQPQAGPQAVEATGAVNRERQLRDALAACQDVEPAVSREQCESEARRAYEGTPATPPGR